MSEKKAETKRAKKVETKVRGDFAILNSDAKQRAEIRDLKARLEATRRHIELTCPRAFLSSDKCSCGECTAHNAADLTIKNWRKP